MKAEEPTKQHSRLPWRWGWYYLEQYEQPVTGLMSKRRAVKTLRSAGLVGSYGKKLARRKDAPKSFLRKITWPRNSG